MSSEEEQQSPRSDAESPVPTKKETSEATKKIIRVLTVLAYLSSVSMAAIMLSLYYIFLWQPTPNAAARSTETAEVPHFLVNPNVTKLIELAPEEPRALPVQVAEPRSIEDESVARLHSDESNERSWETPDTYKSLREKRQMKRIRRIRSIKVS